MVVINAGLPVLSNRSRRTITAEELALDSPGTPAAHPQQGGQP
ncbi:hypothetical protein ACFXDI_52025 [Streptomyces mirabilis]